MTNLRYILKNERNKLCSMLSNQTGRHTGCRKTGPGKYAGRTDYEGKKKGGFGFEACMYLGHSPLPNVLTHT